MARVQLADFLSKALFHLDPLHLHGGGQQAVVNGPGREQRPHFMHPVRNSVRARRPGVGRDWYASYGPQLWPGTWADTILDSPKVRFYPVDDETTVHYASIYRQLKRKGRPIPTNDLWIAADCMQQGFRLLTADKRFTEIDGLLTGQVPFEFLR